MFTMTGYYSTNTINSRRYLNHHLPVNFINDNRGKIWPQDIEGRNRLHYKQRLQIEYNEIKFNRVGHQKKYVFLPDVTTGDK